MGVATLVLVVNPGSASRKYALYAGTRLRAQLHFEHVHNSVVCTITAKKKQTEIPVELSDVSGAAEHVLPLLNEYGVLGPKERISRIGVRIVTPGMFFLEDRLVTDEVIDKLEFALRRAPLHISATLHELTMLRSHFADTPIIGISDSAYHSTKPDAAWNYGIKLEDADNFDIKRFGYHGISVSAAVRKLKELNHLHIKCIVCHVGSGVSVTAIHNGKSLDNSMGFSPLEGVVMGTRSGNIDASALFVLKEELSLDDRALETYLNSSGGLLGLSGISSDVRDLLAAESEGDHAAQLALETYVYNIQKAIGQMSAVLNGTNMLVFTGTVGERSAIIRKRIIERLMYLGFMVDDHVNDQCTNPSSVISIGHETKSKPIFVVPTDEAAAIAHHTLEYKL